MAKALIDSVVDTERYPLADPVRSRPLVERCRRLLERDGSFSLENFLRHEALAEAVRQIEPRMARIAHRHVANHNVYFTDEVPGVPAEHGALARLESVNHTLTCDQLGSTHVRAIYEWDALLVFLASVLETRCLYRMKDPLARLNVMGYEEGDTLNWHFDRSQYTVTLLLQSSLEGGVFEYRRHLRSDSDPRYDAVARLLAGEDPWVRPLKVSPGTLNVFAGRYAAHRVTPVQGRRMRLVAILSYAESPDAVFTEVDRMRFYGRSQ